MTGIRLTAPAPGWAIDADVVVVGSGVAGLTTALRCAAAGLTTVVVTKARLDDGSTRWAQGGIAAAIGEGDTPEQHLDDTLVAGAGLCDASAVRALVTEPASRTKNSALAPPAPDATSLGDSPETVSSSLASRRTSSTKNPCPARGVTSPVVAESAVALPSTMILPADP